MNKNPLVKIPIHNSYQNSTLKYGCYNFCFRHKNKTPEGVFVLTIFDNSGIISLVEAHRYTVEFFAILVDGRRLKRTVALSSRIIAER